MNRRQLLLRGALIAALAPVVRASGVAQLPDASDAPAIMNSSGAVILAVHDPAYRRSREFALGLEQRGARRIGLEPDALTAWHVSLRAVCAAAPGVRIAGLTTRTDYLVLCDLARAAGLQPLATRDADARIELPGLARRRATLIAWVLGTPAQGHRAGIA